MNFIDREIKTWKKQSNIEPPKVSNIIKFSYYKLPYIGNFSKTTKQKLNKICDQYCKDLSLKIVFALFKLGIYLVSKMQFPNFWSLLLFTNLSVQAVMPVILVRQLAISEQGSKNIWRRTKSHILLSI